MNLREGIYRAMEEENGMPKLGTSATTLGARKGKDVIPDSAGLVYRPAFVPGQPNGLSCAPTIQSLPPFALPTAWGGANKKTEVWFIDAADLGPDLVAQEDGYQGKRRHISVGPSKTMSFDAYAAAIQATQAKWKKVTRTTP